MKRAAVVQPDHKSAQVEKSGQQKTTRRKCGEEKTPKLLGEEFLSPGQGIQIYAISATDMSATEDEAVLGGWKSKDGVDCINAPWFCITIKRAELPDFFKGGNAKRMDGNHGRTT